MIIKGNHPEETDILPIQFNIKNLDVYIENQHILKDINLTIPEKSITCIIGPSGCGKSTLLKTLNRMHDETPEVKITGKVIVDDENIYSPRCQCNRYQEEDGTCWLSDHVRCQCQFLTMWPTDHGYMDLKEEKQ